MESGLLEAAVLVSYSRDWENHVKNLWIVTGVWEKWHFVELCECQQTNFLNGEWPTWSCCSCVILEGLGKTTWNPFPCLQIKVRIFAVWDKSLCCYIPEDVNIRIVEASDACPHSTFNVLALSSCRTLHLYWGGNLAPCPWKRHEVFEWNPINSIVYWLVNVVCSFVTRPLPFCVAMRVTGLLLHSVQHNYPPRSACRAFLAATKRGNGYLPSYSWQLGFFFSYLRNGSWSCVRS